MDIIPLTKGDIMEDIRDDEYVEDDYDDEETQGSLAKTAAFAAIFTGIGAGAVFVGRKVKDRWNLRQASKATETTPVQEIPSVDTTNVTEE